MSKSKIYRKISVPQLLSQKTAKSSIYINLDSSYVEYEIGFIDRITGEKQQIETLLQKHIPFNIPCENFTGLPGHHYETKMKNIC